MLAELRSLDTGRRSLRNFGFVVGGVLMLIGSVVAWKTGSPASTAALVLLLAGAALVILGAASPRLLKGPYLVWMALALVLGAVMTRVILTLVYLCIVTPIGWTLRLLGRDPMHRRPDAEMSTYWIPREPVDDPRRQLTRYY